ncbi:hypothetical protein NM688_g9228 [Phlebia brevispora]|uniref:Uncharacterized protein n=1 Tax=Phlebia brevispora TaxID=194682 RepID=A0ACC1RJW5_9APHY|nr:hypothetical protein NM688_g9228 [Phlebia brevispora]
MPNQYQLAFLASFTAVFTFLLLASNFIRAKLADAGAPFAFLTTKGSMLTQLFALVLAVATTAFVYYKFGSKRTPVLDPKKWQEFPLTQKIIISPNTALYRFALPHPQDILGLPIGQHISVAAEINGKDIMRSYTPTSSDDDLGHFDLVIKAYEKGNISRHISLLKIGDKIKVKGPKGQFTYSPDLSREIGMIAGGTGITPMLQIVRAALKNPQDKTKLSLIYANVNAEDILLKKELDELASAHPDRFTVFYVLNNPPHGWKGGVGFVTKEHIEKHMPPSSHDIKVLMCGPPPMMTAMKKYLDELKYHAPRTISKLGDQHTQRKGADIILRSHDGVQFRTHSLTLKLGSAWFRTPFTLSQTHAADSGRDPGAHVEGNSTSVQIQTIDVPESSAVVASLLHILNSQELPKLDSLSYIIDLLHAAEKYEMQGVISVMRLAIVSPTLLEKYPIRIYGIACQYGWQDEAKVASSRTIGLNLLSREVLPELALMKGSDLMRLMDLHRRRRDALKCGLDSGVLDANQLPGLHRYAWLNAIETSPQEFTGNLDVLYSQELRDLLAATCGTPTCQRKLYDTDTTLQNIRTILADLPRTVEGLTVATVSETPRFIIAFAR